MYNELEEANHYIEQLEDELLRMKQSRKALQNNVILNFKEVTYGLRNSKLHGLNIIFAEANPATQFILITHFGIHTEVQSQVNIQITYV